MTTKLLQTESREILRKAIKDLRAQGWQTIGKVQPFLIFDGPKFDRLVFQQSVARRTNE